MTKKILIIKLGALGDVLRTTPILLGIKEKFNDSEIYWLTKKDSVEILENNPYIYKILVLPYNFSEKDKFDVLYNFEIEEEPCKLALKIKADKKYGFYYNQGYPNSFNLASEYYLNTFFDDIIKRENKKTYQEMIFEVAELEYRKQPIIIYLNSDDKKYAENFVNKDNIKIEKLIGIHMGASSRWPSKSWSKNKIKELIKRLNERNYSVMLFGGPNEKNEHKKLNEELVKEGIEVYYNDPNNSIKQFASLVNLCKFMICSDTFALHVSLALKKPTIGLFFCTSPNEIEDYSLLKKITSPLLYDFFPDKMNLYDEKLVNSISTEEVLSALDILLTK